MPMRLQMSVGFSSKRCQGDLHQQRLSTRADETHGGGRAGVAWAMGGQALGQAFSEQVTLGVPGRSCLTAGGFQWLLLAEEWAVRKFGLLAMSLSLCKCSECFLLGSASAPHLPLPVPTPRFCLYFQKGPLYDNESYLKQKWFCRALHMLQNKKLSAAKIKCLESYLSCWGGGG